jgi:hypothetical protein
MRVFEHYIGGFLFFHQRTLSSLAKSSIILFGSLEQTKTSKYLLEIKKKKTFALCFFRYINGRKRNNHLTSDIII